ncbi:uncharacterized protein LOC116125621 isoform X3 [Pistacia vera]|uniref:uncharacterized protein LOC116125621 isoform X3 n=1 Tax=Pistacia vera TaxID=55513 RepID=UPI0012638C2F|nr:uncharacterized protein LOC116125621 isoform X3 [Pistacia vera]
MIIFAQPFTVDRSVSKPLVDLTEPPLNWLNTHSLPFDSSIKTSNFVEAKPYYPSYISPPTYDDYTQSLTGLWDGSNGWNYPKNDINVSDLPVYKDHMDTAAHSPKVLNTCEEKSQMLGFEKHLGSCNIEGFDYKSFSGQNTEFMPVEYSRKSFVGSTSVFPESYSLASYEKGISPNDVTSVRKSSPGLVIGAPNTTAFNNVGISGLAHSIDFAANSNLSDGKVPVDSSKVSFNLEGDHHSFLELSPEKKEKLLSNISVTKDPFRTNSIRQVAHISSGGNDTLNCFENSFDSLDHYNHAVDSPCWKGVPVSHYSALEASGPVPPQLTKTIEACSGSNLIGPTNNAVKFCSQKPSEFPLYQGYGCLENDLAPSPERISVANMLIRELGSHDDVKEGYYQSSYGHGFQLSDDIEKSRKEYVLSKNSMYGLNFKPFHSTQQSVEEGKPTSERKCESGTGVEDVGMTTSDSSEGCSSHVPFHATEHVLSSPPAVEAAPFELTKMYGKQLAPKICVQTLISTMHNLSELLLSHCSNEACELKKQELSALKNVVNNLDKCILKNLGTVVPLQESLFPDITSQFLGGLPKLHEGVTLSRSQVTKEAAVTDLNRPDYQCGQEERKHFTPDKLDENFWDFASLRGDVDREKDDKVTQAIKKVLSENFFEEDRTQPQILLYKNLWLEAEAALCSVNYRARFNRMKIEMEKCKSLKAKDLSENTTVASDLSKDNAEVEKLSWSSFSPDTKTAEELKPEVYDSIRDVSAPAVLIVTKGDHPDDVMARFNILKRKVNSANYTSTKDAPKLSSSEVSHDLNEFDRMASAAKDDQTPDTSSWDLPVSSPNSLRDDVKASVMARFQILKNRVDNAVCTNIDGELQQAFNLGFAEVKKHGPAEDEVLDGNMEPVLQNNFSNYIEDKLTMKEFHLRIKDDPVIHVHRTDRLGNQLPGASYDSSSSDWEHVLKEELPAQNC